MKSKFNLLLLLVLSCNVCFNLQHMCFNPGMEPKCQPVLLINSNTAAIIVEVDNSGCVLDAATSTHKILKSTVFYKMSSLKSTILTDARADLIWSISKICFLVISLAKLVSFEVFQGFSFNQMPLFSNSNIVINDNMQKKRWHFVLLLRIDRWHITSLAFCGYVCFISSTLYIWPADGGHFVIFGAGTYLCNQQKNAEFRDAPITRRHWFPRPWNISVDCKNKFLIRPSWLVYIKSWQPRFGWPRGVRDFLV